MPSKSGKQARTMRAAAHDSSFAKRMGIPQSVAKEFARADAASVMPRKKKQAAKQNPAPAKSGY